MSDLMTQTVVSIPSVLEPHLARIGAFIAGCLVDRELPPTLREGMEYALAGGKHLRPLLTTLCCEAAGGRAEQSLPAGAALEMIHGFSLVHDDLPAMDDDDLRRGQPTMHRRFGEAMAILVGDALQAMAFEFLTDPSYDETQQALLVRELTQATTCMIAGQVYDTLGGIDSGLSDREALSLIHSNKTGALIRAACRMGAITAGADEAAIVSVTTYGEAIGFMFQIVDDLLDVEQSAEHTGKATGKDIDAGKLTFPGLLGVNESRREIERLRQTANNEARQFGPVGVPLIELSDYMAIRTR